MAVGGTWSDPTPDDSRLTRVRARSGPTRLSQVVAVMREQLNAAGRMRDGFTVVEATQLIANAPVREERDTTRQQTLEPLNAAVLPKGAVYKQARIGWKGKKKEWYGYKEHGSVDRQSGLINKVASTPANLPDAHGVSGHAILPRCGHRILPTL
jgi:transposase, IS5 family